MSVKLHYPQEASEESMQRMKDYVKTVEIAEQFITELKMRLGSAPERQRIAIEQLRIDNLNAEKWLRWYEARRQELIDSLNTVEGEE
tara:strand:+ start:1428 stop:1688 length:261 start_codon:yes stop_codon:yes gene_type:complete